MTNNIFFSFEIPNPQISNEKCKCHSSSLGKPERGICFITGSSNASSKSTAVSLPKLPPLCEVNAHSADTQNDKD